MYLQALQAHLPNIRDGGNLASVLEHCTYCGSSLSRIGVDFQGLLQPLFESCTLQLFSSHLELAVESFNSRLESHKWLAMPTPMFSKKAPADGHSSGSATAGASATNGDSNAESEPDLSPPYAIMEHFPLAIFTNCVLAALNDLRHCAMLSLRKPMGLLLQAALEQVASSLVHYRHTHSLSDSEGQLFRSAAKALVDIVAPYISTCYSRVFSPGAPKLDIAAVVSLVSDAVSEQEK